MSLDTTNSEMLDVSPFAEDFSSFNFFTPFGVSNKNKKGRKYVITKLKEKAEALKQQAQKAQAQSAQISQVGVSSKSKWKATLAALRAKRAAEKAVAKLQAAIKANAELNAQEAQSQAPALAARPMPRPRPYIIRPASSSATNPLAGKPKGQTAEQVSAQQTTSTQPKVEKSATTDKMPQTQPVSSKDAVLKPLKGAESPESVGSKGTSTDTAQDSPFYKAYWFWGVVIGAAAGYFYSKNKNTAMLTSLFVGGAIGGAVGFGVQTFGSPAATSKSVSADTSLAPSGSEQEPTQDESEGQVQDDSQGQAQEDAGQTNAEQ